jgi:hypothetical protein
MLNLVVCWVMGDDMGAMVMVLYCTRRGVGTWVRIQGREGEKGKGEEGR